METIERRLSLFDIEIEKADLIQFREELTDPAEIGAADKAIQEYIGREIKKVSNIAALLRYFKSQAEVAKAEKERAAKWQQRWEASYERLKNMVHGVMMALDFPKVEGATDRFRRQKNPPAVEIIDVGLIPDEFMRVTVKMPYNSWKELTSECILKPDFTSVTSEVDAAALKAALQSGKEISGAKLTQGEHLRVE